MGSVTVVSAGSVESDAVQVYGLLADSMHANGGDATTHLTQTGVVEMSSEYGVGLYSLSRGAGSAIALADGTVTMSGYYGAGLLSWSQAEGDAIAELRDGGAITISGDAGDGIYAIADGTGNVMVRSSGTIVTTGTGARGMSAVLANPGSLAQVSVIVAGDGSVATNGDQAPALQISNDGSGASTVQLMSNASLTTQGTESHGVIGTSTGLLSLSQSASSQIEVSGGESFGVNLTSASDTSLQLEGRVTATGEYGIGAASMAGTGTVQQHIAATATVTGGWQADVSGFGATSSLPSAGVLLDAGGVAQLINRGTIGAGSDRAVVAQGADVTVDNFGTLTGFVQLSGGSVVFNNEPSSTFELRHFADTDGDTIRDTKRVAIADFGDPTSTFNNSSNAVLKLGLIEGESSVDATGYYVPTTGSDYRALDTNDYRLNRAGIVQGQLVNVGTFSHSGIIDLRGPAVGNTLVITAAPTASGTPGNGVFVSNGGTLLLNVVLNEGIAPDGQTGSLADVLIVDGTQMGTGATTISLDRREGDGAVTPGNGILLVEVRDKARSAPDVFTLNGDYTYNGVPSVVLGAYAYSLYHHGVGGDAGDGNWYLRSSVLDLEPPDPDPSGPVSSDPSDPPPVDPSDPTPSDPSDPTSSDPTDPPTDPTDPTPSDPLDPVPSEPTDPTPIDEEPSEPIDPDEEPDEDDPIAADPAEPSAPSPSEDAPRYQPGVPVYESYGANLLALNGLPTLEQRMGDRIWGLNADRETGGAWLRMYGTGNRARPLKSTTRVEQSTDAWKTQFGFEHLVATSEDGDRLVGSIAVEYGEADTSVRSIFGPGEISTRGYGMGTMWTWYGRRGAYVDAQVQLNRFKSDLHSAILGRLVHDNDGRGKAFSLEVGRKLDLNDEWSLTPQTQLTYSSVRFDRFVDPFGAVVILEDADSLISRFGLALTRDATRHDRHNRFYAVANLSYEWDNGVRVRVSGVEIERMERREWAELGFGGSINWSNGVRLYGEISGKSPLHDIANSYSVHGTVGISMRFY
jgi:outer membrane autotransporter protein